VVAELAANRVSSCLTLACRSSTALLRVFTCRRSAANPGASAAAAKAPWNGPINAMTQSKPRITVPRLPQANFIVEDVLVSGSGRAYFDAA
jgi:hypothetical protein